MCALHIAIYFKRIKRILLEKKSGSETVEVMKLKWPYHEKYFFVTKLQN